MSNSESSATKQRVKIKNLLQCLMKPRGRLCVGALRQPRTCYQSPNPADGDLTRPAFSCFLSKDNAHA